MQEIPASRRRFRWLKILLLGTLSLVLLVGAAVVVWWYIVTRAGDRELREALADVSEIEPVVELPELDAQRQTIPDEKNAALAILSATKLLPPEFPDDELAEKLRTIPPWTLLDQETFANLETELGKGKPTLDSLRCLEHLSNGRYPVQWDRNPLATDMNHLRHARKAANLLCWEAIRRAQVEDVDGCLAALGEALNAGRSIGDEPAIVSQLVRIACQGVVFDGIERALAQGKPSPASLTRMQQVLELEAAEPIFLILVRGERASVHGVCLGMDSGSIPLLGETSGGTLEEYQATVYVRLTLKSAHASILRTMTEMLVIARQPAHEWNSSVAQLKKLPQELPVLSRIHLMAMKTPTEACTRSQAMLRCAIAALALERYRLAVGHWPESLDVLTPAYLREVPLDPYNGKPLLLRRLAEGVVVYAVGPDGEDNGGKLDRQRRVSPGTDVGLQLWDPDRRRQPATEEDQ